jgi:flagellar biosynthesis/type III secretory pathway protein FliH
LLQSSVHETARAERLILGTAKAHQAYAEAMQASYEDGFLDKKNTVVLIKKQQKRLADQRVETTGSNKTLPIMAATDDERKANMLTSIMEAQHDLAKKFGENAREMEEEIASELTQMRIELEKKVASIHLPGDAILAELEKTEAEVSEAWGKTHCTARY